MDLDKALPILLGLAWLLPLASFALILLFGPRMGKAGRGAGYLATAAIIASFVLSLAALGTWLSHHPVTATEHHAAGHEAAGASGPVEAVSGDWYALGTFGSLRITIGYYIDALTLAMFCMVTLVAGCIHVYSFGYMHEELEEVTDPLVTLSDGSTLKRRGRFHRFFQYFSLFCFSMLGLVIAGNIAMVFVFWELVGICSYLLIGFYFERHSASTAGNKAFIVNRVGDFGMVIGLMALWAGLGTFSFGDVKDADGRVLQRGIFSQVRAASEDPERHRALVVPDGMVKLAARDEVEKIALASPDLATAREAVDASVDDWRSQGYGHWLLVVAGLGIFCGCVGKSAQFPLHVWLPDAMEGPTPVSALIHAATMVAAGVYLVGRFYPAFTPDVLLVIAYTGCITLFVAATVAITATDIKRVLAYSTVSQLGYMMLGLGVGGWIAGLFHLFTHACFKALLFLCSGSVIHACGTNEMPQMGGLRKKMPWTAATMLVGCLAISGAGIPLLFGGFGLSGFHSKDSILAQAYSFWNGHPGHPGHPLHGALLFVPAALGAAITSFYMFRLWYMTFAGKPRDEHVYEHAHESPRSMTVPLVILAVLAAIAGWVIPLSGLSLPSLLEQARPAGTAEGVAMAVSAVAMPAEHLSHLAPVHVPVSLIAFGTALAGFILATAFYGLRTLDPEDVRRQFAALYRLFRNKWWFDELYDRVFVRPVLRISDWVAAIDRRGIDWLADGLARWTVAISRLDDWIDRLFVDGLVNGIAKWTYGVALWLRTLQTGKLRLYVVWIVVGTVALFVLISFFRDLAVAGL